MRKAQTISQVFIYILTIIIFGVILLYGYNSIRNMSQRADQVLLIQLKKEMVNAIEKTDYGSVTKQELSLPGRFNEICFIDLDYSNPSITDICDSGHPDYQPLVCDSWEDKAPENMFLIKDKATIESHDIGNIKIGSPYYDCIKAVQGKVTIKLEGKGKYVELSEWPK